MAKTSLPLAPSQEKIKRAQSKFNQLKAVINAYAASQPYSLRIDRYPNAHVLVARRDRDPPEDIAHEIVEIVGHLRAALDKLIVATVELNGRGISGVGFPFGSVDNGVPQPFPTARMEQVIKKKLTDDQWALIESYRPYPGGNDIFWAINQIANADKHGRDLVTVIPINTGNLGVGGGDSLWRLDQIIHNPPHDPTGPYDKDREKVLIAVIGGSGKLNLDHSPIADVVFEDIPPVTGNNVLTTLNDQIRITEHIVKAFRDAFF